MTSTSSASGENSFTDDVLISGDHVGSVPAPGTMLLLAIGALALRRVTAA